MSNDRTPGRIGYEAYASKAEADWAETASAAEAGMMRMRPWGHLPPNLQAAWEVAGQAILRSQYGRSGRGKSNAQRP